MGKLDRQGICAHILWGLTSVQKMRLWEVFITFPLIPSHFLFWERICSGLFGLNCLSMNCTYQSFIVPAENVCLPFPHHFLSVWKGDPWKKALRASFSAYHTNTIWRGWGCFRCSITEEVCRIHIHSAIDVQKLETRTYWK